MREKTTTVSMRVRIGDSELEVTGPKAFVESKIDEFVNSRKAPTSKTPPTGGSVFDAGNVTPGRTSKKISVAQFFRNIAPKSDVARALFAGYYLEKYENAESFTAAEIREIIRNAKITPPKNASDTVAKNIKKGLMMSAGDKDGKMAFVLTSDGEDAVSQALKPS